MYLAWVVPRDATARPDGRERSPARRPQVALQWAECSWELQPRAEPARLRVAQQELVDESVSARQEEQASRQLQRLQAPAMAQGEQFSELRAQRPEALSDELQELPV